MSKNLKLFSLKIHKGAKDKNNYMEGLNSKIKILKGSP